MDFNLDDPLAGILSDGSDDSFFNDDILGKKKTPSKKSTPIAQKKSALFDLGDEPKPKPEPKAKAEPPKKDALFGFDDETPKPEDKRPVTSDLKVPPSPFKRTLSKESVTFQDNELKNVPLKSPAKPKPVDKLVLDRTETKREPTKILEKGKSSQSLLDDILGGSSRPTTSQTQLKPLTRPTTGKSQEFDFDSIIGNESKSKIPKDDKPKPTPKVDKEPKEDNQAKKTTGDDWLGLFQDSPADDDGDGMPSWLVGKETKKKKEEKPAPSKEVEMPKENDQEMVDQTILKPVQSVLMPVGNEDVATEGAALYLQQQESQLMVALQLKAQEEKLAAMQMRQEESAKVQREASKANHAQVEAMLQRQAAQRRLMQAAIADHQDRIAQRIKAMLGAPKANDSNDEENYDNEGSAEIRETPHSKEKKQLLQLVQSLQENHDKEIDLMETSYRRQLAFLEISLNQTEERMKEESEKVHKFYTEKISWLEEHHTLYKKLVEDNMVALTERNKTENEMLRHQHLDNVRILQEHHAALMENVKNAVKQEQVVIKDAAGFSTDLVDLVADVKESKAYCRQLADRVQAMAETSVREGERSIQARDAQINDMIQQLKLERERFETEKTENREMVKLLETRLKQMTMLIEEEAAALKQKRMEFEFEKATFNKQTEFAKNVLKKQDEEVKMLKDEIKKEYQDKISKIDEEKAKAQRDSLAVAKEKSAVQNLRQELEKMKSELQIQMEEVSEDRSKVNIEKQHIHMEEQRVLAKSRDLDLLAKAAMEKQTQADAKYAEAESIQRKYEERIRRIQEHVVSLNNREKQIAREKVSLSRERLSLHNEKKQMDGLQQCSLCRTQNIPQYNYETYTSHDVNGINGISRDYGAPYVSSAVNAFESEMAHLLGRNFGLRNTVGNPSAVNEVVDDNLDSKEPASSMKDYMDPKLMMLRLDVQQVLSNMEYGKNVNEDINELPDDHKE